MEGFFKVPRDIIESDEYLSEKFSRGQALIDLINLALYREKTYRIRGIEVVGNPGEVHYSSQYLAERWQWSRGKVMRFLDELEEKRYIEQQKTPVIKVLRLLFLDGHSTTERTLNRTTNRTPDGAANSTANSTTLEEGKKERRKEGENTIREREAPTPEVLSNFDKSDSGKPEASAVNTQAEPEGQKKKSFGQKRKGTEPAISEADFVAAALPEKFNPRQPGYLDLCNALADFYREKKGKKTAAAAKACKHQLDQYDIRTCINSLQMAALGKWEGFHPKRPGPEFMPHLIEQQSSPSKPAQTQINGSSVAIDKSRPGWLQQNIKYLETYKNFDQALDLRADLYFLQETGRLPNAGDLNEVKKAHEAGKIDLMALNLD